MTGVTYRYSLQFNDISLMSWNQFILFSQTNDLEPDKVYFCDYLGNQDIFLTHLFSEESAFFSLSVVRVLGGVASSSGTNSWSKLVGRVLPCAHANSLSGSPLEKRVLNV